MKIYFFKTLFILLLLPISLYAKSDTSWLIKSQDIIDKVNTHLSSDKLLVAFFIQSINLELDFSEQVIKVTPKAKLINTLSGDKNSYCEIVFQVVPTPNNNGVLSVERVSDSCLK